MELKDLVGLHVLDAVDMEIGKIKNYMDWDEDAQIIRFRLDGKTYIATEDPDDGYRSHMKDINESTDPMNNSFPPCKVIGSMDEDQENDTLEFKDLVTGKTVLRVGTDNTDDYYPMFISEFNPENMAINQSKGESHA